MQDEQRRKFTPEQKFKIVKEALTTNTTVSDICKKYGIVVSLFYRWQDDFFEGALNGLERKKSGPASTAEQRKIDQLEKDNQRMKLTSPVSLFTPHPWKELSSTSIAIKNMPCCMDGLLLRFVASNLFCRSYLWGSAPVSKNGGHPYFLQKCTRFVRARHAVPLLQQTLLIISLNDSKIS